MITGILIENTDCLHRYLTSFLSLWGRFPISVMVATKRCGCDGSVLFKEIVAAHPSVPGFILFFFNIHPCGFKVTIMPSRGENSYFERRGSIVRIRTWPLDRGRIWYSRRVPLCLAASLVTCRKCASKDEFPLLSMSLPAVTYWVLLRGTSEDIRRSSFPWLWTPSLNSVMV